MSRDLLICSDCSAVQAYRSSRVQSNPQEITSVGGVCATASCTSCVAVLRVLRLPVICTGDILWLGPQIRPVAARECTAALARLQSSRLLSLAQREADCFPLGVCCWYIFIHHLASALLEQSGVGQTGDLPMDTSPPVDPVPLARSGKQTASHTQRASRLQFSALQPLL